MPFTRCFTYPYGAKSSTHLCTIRKFYCPASRTIFSKKFARCLITQGPIKKFSLVRSFLFFTVSTVSTKYNKYSILPYFPLLFAIAVHILNNQANCVIEHIFFFRHGDGTQSARLLLIIDVHLLRNGRSSWKRRPLGRTKCESVRFSWKTRVEISDGAMLSLVISDESRSDCAAKIKKPRSPFAAEIRGSKESVPRNDTRARVITLVATTNWPTLKNIRGTDALAEVSVNVRKQRKFRASRDALPLSARLSFGSFHLLPRGKRPCNFTQWKPPARYRSSRVADWLNARDSGWKFHPKREHHEPRYGCFKPLEPLGYSLSTSRRRFVLFIDVPLIRERKRGEEETKVVFSHSAICFYSIVLIEYYLFFFTTHYIYYLSRHFYHLLKYKYLIFGAKSDPVHYVLRDMYKCRRRRRILFYLRLFFS